MRRALTWRAARVSNGTGDVPSLQAGSRTSASSAALAGWGFHASPHRAPRTSSLPIRSSSASLLTRPSARTMEGTEAPAFIPAIVRSHIVAGSTPSLMSMVRVIMRVETSRPAIRHTVPMMALMVPIPPSQKRSRGFAPISWPSAIPATGNAVRIRAEVKGPDRAMARASSAAAASSILSATISSTSASGVPSSCVRRHATLKV